MRTSMARKRIERLFRKHQTEIQRLAAEVREAVVIPACKKHKLNFFAGNGTFFFSREIPGKNTWDIPSIRSWDEAKKDGLSMKRVFEMLFLDVGKDDYLGDYIEDVRFDTLGV